jgi:hypothetical protein
VCEEVWGDQVDGCDCIQCEAVICDGLSAGCDHIQCEAVICDGLRAGCDHIQCEVMGTALDVITSSVCRAVRLFIVDRESHHLCCARRFIKNKQCDNERI